MTASTGLIDNARDPMKGPLTAVGGFFRMCVLTGKALFRRPFQWREFILQGWFITRVAFLPTVMVSIPITVLVVFTLNVLLAQFGAADLSGAGAALGAVTQLGPLTTVLWWWPAPARRPSAPTWEHAPSGRRSTRWRCSASTPSTGWWCPG